jgi:hypothetical protein
MDGWLLFFASSLSLKKERKEFILQYSLSLSLSNVALCVSGGWVGG